jgi:hypothetical protein
MDKPPRLYCALRTTDLLTLSAIKFSSHFFTGAEKDNRVRFCDGMTA